MRFTEALAVAQRLQRAARERAEGDDQRRIRIEHVAPRAAAIVGPGELNHRVSIGDRPILRQARGGTPAAARKAERERGVERAAVHAALPSAYDPLQLHSPLEPWACAPEPRVVTKFAHPSNMKELFVCALIAAALGVPRANAAVAMSDGSDGAFHATVDAILAVDADAVFNFTDFTIDPGVTVRIGPEGYAGPVSLLASQRIFIGGILAFGLGAPAPLSAPTIALE